MTAVPVGAARGSWRLPRTLFSSAAHVAGLAVRALSRPASLRNLTKMPFTLAGFACINYGVFQASGIAGYITTGITLMVLELMVADE